MNKLLGALALTLAYCSIASAQYRYPTGPSTLQCQINGTACSTGATVINAPAGSTLSGGVLTIAGSTSASSLAASVSMTANEVLTGAASATNTTALQFTTAVADGASSVAAYINNSVTLSTTGALLLKLANNGTSKFSVDFSGAVTAANTITSANNLQVGSGGRVDVSSAGQFGVGSGIATSVVLGRSGIPVVEQGSWETKAVAVADAAYSAVAGDYLIYFSSITAGRTVTLLQTGSATAQIHYRIENHTSSVQTITVAANTGNVNGAASITCTSVAWGGCEVACDGTNCYLEWSR